MSRRYGAQHRKDVDDYKSIEELTSFLGGDTLRECSVTCVTSCLGAVLDERRQEDAAAEEVGVADAVRDRSRAHAVLASAAAHCDLLSAGWNSPAWAGSIAVGQLETTHQRRAARSRHQLLQTLHKNSWAFSSYVVCPYNSKSRADPRACNPTDLLLLWLGTHPRSFATQPRSSRLSHLVATCCDVTQSPSSWCRGGNGAQHRKDADDYNSLKN